MAWTIVFGLGCTVEIQGNFFKPTPEATPQTFLFCKNGKNHDKKQ